MPVTPYGTRYTGEQIEAALEKGLTKKIVNTGWIKIASNIANKVSLNSLRTEGNFLINNYGYGPVDDTIASPINLMVVTIGGTLYQLVEANQAYYKRKYVDDAWTSWELDTLVGAMYPGPTPPGGASDGTVWYNTDPLNPSLKLKKNGTWVDVLPENIMQESIYDPEGKHTDIFAFIDEKIGELSADTVSDDFDSHADDKIIHLSSEERNKWNGGADLDYLKDAADEVNDTLGTAISEEASSQGGKVSQAAEAMTALASNIDTHINNTTIHPSQAKIDEWNNKAAKNHVHYLQDDITVNPNAIEGTLPKQLVRSDIQERVYTVDSLHALYQTQTGTVHTGDILRYHNESVPNAADQWYLVKDDSKLASSSMPINRLDLNAYTCVSSGRPFQSFTVGDYWYFCQDTTFRDTDDLHYLTRYNYKTYQASKVLATADLDYPKIVVGGTHTDEGFILAEPYTEDTSLVFNYKIRIWLIADENAKISASNTTTVEINPSLTFSKNYDGTDPTTRGLQMNARFENDWKLVNGFANKWNPSIQLGYDSDKDTVIMAAQGENGLIIYASSDKGHTWDIKFTRESSITNPFGGMKLLQAKGRWYLFVHGGYQRWSNCYAAELAGPSIYNERMEYRNAPKSKYVDDYYYSDDGGLTWNIVHASRLQTTTTNSLVTGAKTISPESVFYDGRMLIAYFGGTEIPDGSGNNTKSFGWKFSVDGLNWTEFEMNWDHAVYDSSLSENDDWIYTCASDGNMYFLCKLAIRNGSASRYDGLELYNIARLNGRDVKYPNAIYWYYSHSIFERIVYGGGHSSQYSAIWGEIKIIPAQPGATKGYTSSSDKIKAGKNYGLFYILDNGYGGKGNVPVKSEGGPWYYTYLFEINDRYKEPFLLINNKLGNVDWDDIHNKPTTLEELGVSGKATKTSYEEVKSGMPENMDFGGVPQMQEVYKTLDKDNKHLSSSLSLLEETVSELEKIMSDNTWKT